MLHDSLVELPQSDFVFLVPDLVHTLALVILLPSILLAVLLLDHTLFLLILLLDHTLLLLIRFLPSGQLLINTLLCEFFLT